ncbi:FKBPL protein, partial [Rhinopomastus cyanomelas]|nr:FKBPL protein [Rhinopomastus cyanomelas]
MAAGEWAWLCPARAGPPGAFLGIRLGGFSQATPLWMEPWVGRWAAAQERRRRAEQLLAEGAVGAAARSFSQALRVAAAAMTPPMSPWEAALMLKAELHAQLALCQLRLGLPAAAAVNAGKALQLQPRHLEARYRRGVAAAATGDLEAAAEDLRAVLRAEPGHARAGQELRRVRGAARQRDAGLARRLGRLFA